MVAYFSVHIRKESKPHFAHTSTVKLASNVKVGIPKERKNCSTIREIS